MRLTENVTNFSLALEGLIGGNRRVGVVDHCRQNLLVRWQSSGLSSSSGSSIMLFLNQSRRKSIVNRQQSKGNEVHAALGHIPAKQLWVRRPGDGQFETQDFPSQCQSVRAATGSVHPTGATECGRSRVNRHFDT